LATKKEYGGADDQQRYHPVDEITVGEDGTVDGEVA
jgi:hypothetical protein